MMLLIIKQIIDFLQCHTYTVLYFMNGAGVCWIIRKTAFNEHLFKPQLMQ